jgi:modulator of FtsH protease
MMTVRSYDPALWQSFFIAIVSAAAALTGLLFVAVSINLENILKGGKFLTDRAAETLATLLLVVAASTLSLAPQSDRLIGIEILAVAVPLFGITTWRQLHHYRTHPDHPILWTISRMGASAAGTLPAMIAGLSLALLWGGGFYWLVPAALLGITGAVYSAWVLLVEIIR